MTRPPQLPPSPPPEPLDASERELARALRSLPAGMPPSELDARILGAARRAVHLQKPQPRDRRWLIGLSTAATAVLAMGILLKMHGLGRDAVLAPPTVSESAAPAAAPVNTPQAASAKNPESSMAADTNVPAGLASGMAAVTPAQPPHDKDGRLREEQSTRSDVLAAKQAPSAFPAEVPPPRSLRPPPPPVILENPSPMAVQSPAPAAPPPMAASDERKESDAAVSGYARRDASALSAPAPAAAAGGMLGQTAQDQAKASKSASNAMEVGEPVPQRQELDKVSVAGARLKAAGPALPALSDDAKLTPAEWIERVRERLRQGDRAGAASSLRAFVHAHPDAIVPADLQPLLH